MVTVEYPPPPKWELGSDAIEKLVGGPGAYMKPYIGRTWNVRVEEEIRDLASKYSPLLENLGALYRHLEDLLRDGGIPRDQKQLALPQGNTRFSEQISRKALMPPVHQNTCRCTVFCTALHVRLWLLKNRSPQCPHAHSIRPAPQVVPLIR